MTRVQIITGDCLAVLKDMADNSVDAVVTDPPYGLGKEPDALAMLTDWIATGHHEVKGRGFMGKAWDAFVPQPALWRECLRVLKPGGHVVAFAGTRTHDLMTLGLRLAGFEIRDTLMWVYGQGFSKGYNLRRETICACEPSGNALPSTHGKQTSKHEMHGMRDDDVSSAAPVGGGNGPVLFTGLPEQGASAYGHPQGQPVDGWTGQPSLEGRQLYRAGQRVSAGPDAGSSEGAGERLRAGAHSRGGNDDGPSVGTGRGSPPHQPRQSGQPSGEFAGIQGSPDALDGRTLFGRGACPQCGHLRKEYEGFGTSLKPALEPITLARKPLAGTVAQNVLAHGTGGLNVDGCRVNRAPDDVLGWSATGSKASENRAMSGANYDRDAKPDAPARWPANLIHDGSDEVLAGFPESKGQQGFVGARHGDRASVNTYGDYGPRPDTPPRGDSGSAARFFYTAHERDDEWLARNLGLLDAITEGQNLCLQRAAAAIARAVAASVPCLAGMRFAVSSEHSTTATASELKRLAECVMQTIPNIGPKFLQEWQHTKLSPTGSLVTAAATREPTGIITITVDRWKSNGFAEPVTFSITPESLDHGEVGSRFRYCAKASKRDREEGLDVFEARRPAEKTGRKEGSVGLVGDAGNRGQTANPYANGGAVASNHHPTVKPTDLMRWLCRLVTPPGGVILDPFMGSGSTGKAAVLEGFRFVGVEMDPEYIEIAKARIAAVDLPQKSKLQQKPQTSDFDPPLFQERT